MVSSSNLKRKFPEITPWQERVDNYLRENYHDTSLSIGKMAYASFVSERQLYRLLKEATGQTPGEYVRAYRLQRAKALLDSGEVASVSELALKVGYVRTEFFSKIFEKAYGYRPVSRLGARRRISGSASGIAVRSSL